MQKLLLLVNLKALCILEVLILFAACITLRTLKEKKKKKRKALLFLNTSNI